jgi:hypothetical protein
VIENDGSFDEFVDALERLWEERLDVGGLRG